MGRWERKRRGVKSLEGTAEEREGEEKVGSGQMKKEERVKENQRRKWRVKKRSVDDRKRKRGGEEQ